MDEEYALPWLFRIQRRHHMISTYRVLLGFQHGLHLSDERGAKVHDGSTLCRGAIVGQKWRLIPSQREVVQGLVSVFT